MPSLPMKERALWIYPPSPPLSLHRRGRLSMVRSTAACGGLPLTGGHGCAIPGGATGVYPPEPPPCPRMGKGGGIGLTRPSTN